MLDFLLQRMLEDSGLGSLAPMLQQFLPMLKGVAANWLTGTSASVLRASDFMGNRTVASMLQAKARSAGMSSMYGRVISGASEAMQERAAISAFRALGYTEANAKIAAGTGLGRMISGVADFVDPTREGVASITSALYSRRNMLRIQGTGGLESYTSQARSGRRLVDTLLKEYNQGSFGRLSFSEVGALTSSMIKTGELDAAYTDRDSMGTADTRTDRVKAKIKSYGESIEKLRDVIEGDMSKILDSMDKLFGGTTVAMSAAKLNKITTAMQHAALVTGVDAKTIAQNAGVGYSYIADLGGTQGMGVRLGLDTTYITQSLPSDARLSQSEMRSAALMSSANIYRSGQAKNLAVGYYAWKQLKDNESRSLDEYVQSLNGDVSNSSLIRSTRASISTQYRGASDDQISAIHAHYNGLTAVTDIMETEAITAVIREQKSEQFITYREQAIRNTLKELKDSGELVGNLDVGAAYHKLTGGDRFARTDDMLNMVTSVVSGAGVGVLSNALKRHRGVAQVTMGTATDRQAEELIRSSGRASQLRKQKLVVSSLNADVTALLNATMASKDTGILEFLMKTAEAKSDSLSSVAGAYLNKDTLAEVSNTSNSTSVASRALQVLGKIKAEGPVDPNTVPKEVATYISRTTNKELKDIDRDNASAVIVAVSTMSDQLYSISQSKEEFPRAIKTAQAQGIPIVKLLQRFVGAPQGSDGRYTEKQVQEALSHYREVGPGAKSAFVGMRKLPGKGAELAAEGERRQRAYIATIQIADDVIRSAQQTGELKDEGRRAIKAAIDASDMEAHEVAVYRLLTDANTRKDTVKYLSTTLRDPKAREKLFSSMKRIDNIAMAVYKGSKKNEISTFRTGAIQLMAKFDKARAEGLGDEVELLRKFKRPIDATTYITSVKDPTKQAELRKAQGLLDEANKLFGDSAGKSELRQNFLDSISRGASGEESWLSAIFTLLTDIFNKMK